MAAEHINAAGGVLGRNVQIVRGSATSAQEGIAAVEQLVGRDKVDVLMGTYVTAISNAASEAALNSNTLYWETNALARDLTDRGLPNYARSGPASRPRCVPTARYAKPIWGFTRAASRAAMHG